MKTKSNGEEKETVTAAEFHVELTTYDGIFTVVSRRVLKFGCMEGGMPEAVRQWLKSTAATVPQTPPKEG